MTSMAFNMQPKSDSDSTDGYGAISEPYNGPRDVPQPSMTPEAVQAAEDHARAIHARMTAFYDSIRNDPNDRNPDGSLPLGLRSWDDPRLLLTGKAWDTPIPILGGDIPATYNGIVNRTFVAVRSSAQGPEVQWRKGEPYSSSGVAESGSGWILLSDPLWTSSEALLAIWRVCMQTWNAHVESNLPDPPGAPASAVEITPPASTASQFCWEPPAFPITVFTPSDLYNTIEDANGKPMGIPSLGFKSETIGRSDECTWAHLVKILSVGKCPEYDWRPFVSDECSEDAAKKIAKGGRGGFSTCRLRDGRRTADSFISAQVLGVDIDHNAHIDTALKAFRRFRKIILTTYSNTESDPRCRVFLIAKAPCIKREEFQRAHDGLCAWLVKSGAYKEKDIDHAGSDPERLWFFPCKQVGATYRVEVTDGEPIDIPRLARTQPPRSPAGKGRFTGGEKISLEDRNAAKIIHLEALRDAQAACSQATDGARHATAVSKSYLLANLSPPLDPEDIARAIVPYAPEGRQDEFVKIVRTALVKAGRLRK